MSIKIEEKKQNALRITVTNIKHGDQNHNYLMSLQKPHATELQRCLITVANLY